MEFPNRTYHNLQMLNEIAVFNRENKPMYASMGQQYPPVR